MKIGRIDPCPCGSGEQGLKTDRHRQPAAQRLPGGGAHPVFHAGTTRAQMLHLARSGEFRRLSGVGRCGADYRRPA